MLWLPHDRANLGPVSAAVVVALLRGINLGPQRRLAMADLRAVVEGLGHTDVRTYLQSGNVVFCPARRAPAEALERALTAAIRDVTKLDVPVLVRTAAQMQAVVGANPYPVTDPTKVVVTFLAAPPPAALAAFDQEPFAPDRFHLHGREVYLELPDGQARSKLVEALWKQHLDERATARNWRTVEALATMSARG